MRSPAGRMGGDPNACVIRDSSGNLYGTTTLGGAAGAGVVYKLDTEGNLTVLSSFAAGGRSPYAGVISDSAGNLYGTAYGGGPAFGGVVFETQAE